ncbi:ABC transporter substrate-binding protein [Pseudonocardia kunmingensis]|uniref:Carbohydrate ABC transporter substrate-binding protein (CUT1 family) n=1 Tax=Pseudonocardia kunmingensis TaxID=630975 RepID=A0A543DB02_9PSEU|nr:ABC transporter substrate-binding protein [Pseudonocardia kunmingensis]TQM06468.1 carbohydrate ABC transporter substrate-binding protein (CUT1 family) [Pseudonocardia kunmingensis]
MPARKSGSSQRGSALRRPSRGTSVLGAALGLSLVLAGCGGSNVAGGGGEQAQPDSEECAAFAQYGDLSGTRVTIYTSIVAPEDQPHIDSYRQFEQCTGTQVVYEGSKEFEAQLPVRVQAGSPPDLAYVPQPGMINTLVTQNPGAVRPAPQAVAANVDQYYSETFKSAGSVDGTLYGAPLGSNVKSYVWYSPQAFAAKGYAVPTTWDEMVALSERIVAEGGKPWCAGIGSGDATGWPLTDWLEDVMLRESGPEVYDQWVSHAIPFNDPRVVAALDRVGSILKDPDFVNGGLGDVSSIATTTFQDGGLPILDETCYMHRQANFYAANFPEETVIAEDGEVFAFELPPIDPAAPQTILVGSEFVVAFSDRPEVQAFQAYLSSPEWANAKAKAGSDLGQSGWISANSGLDPANLSNPIDRQSAEILLDESNTFRFDGSDLMPAAVGSATFWRGMTDWITGQSTRESLDFIEQSWPASQ